MKEGTMKRVALTLMFAAGVGVIGLSCATTGQKQENRTKARMKLAFEAGKQHGYCDCLLNKMKADDPDLKLSGKCEGYQTFETWYWMDRNGQS